MSKYEEIIKLGNAISDLLEKSPVKSFNVKVEVGADDMLDFFEASPFNVGYTSRFNVNRVTFSAHQEVR